MKEYQKGSEDIDDGRESHNDVQKPLAPLDARTHETQDQNGYRDLGDGEVCDREWLLDPVELDDLELLLRRKIKHVPKAAYTRKMGDNGRMDDRQELKHRSAASGRTICPGVAHDCP